MADSAGLLLLRIGRRGLPGSTLFPYATLFRSRSQVPKARLVLVGEGDRYLEFSKVARSSDRKSTRLNSSHLVISYAVFCVKQKMVEVLEAVRTHVGVPVTVTSGDRTVRYHMTR